VRALAAETHEGWLEEHRYLNRGKHPGRSRAGQIMPERRGKSALVALTLLIVVLLAAPALASSPDVLQIGENENAAVRGIINVPNDGGGVVYLQRVGEDAPFVYVRIGDYDPGM